MFNETKPVSDVFNEALNLARINECGIPSPKAIEVTQIEGGENGWALITSKIPGVTLAEKIEAEPQRFGEYLEQFVDLQIEIHGYTSPLLNRQDDKYARMINSLEAINATTRYNLLERLDGLKKGTAEGVIKRLVPVAEYFAEKPENYERMVSILKGIGKLR